MLPDQSAVYCPEELSLLGQILDQAVQSLPLSMRTPQYRAAIAKNILARAATGERDPLFASSSPARYAPRPLKPDRSFKPEAAVHSRVSFVATRCTHGREVTTMQIGGLY